MGRLRKYHTSSTTWMEYLPVMVSVSAGIAFVVARLEVFPIAADDTLGM